MTTESATGLMTADELLRLGKDAHGELVRGVFCETPFNGAAHGRVAATLTYRLYAFTEPRRLGLLTVGMGVWLERDPDTVRSTDVAFTSAERLPPDHPIEGYPEVVPDLVVEGRFHWQGRIEFHDKARMWVSHGAPLVWAVYPDTRTIDVHRPDAPTATLGEGDTLDGGDVLPGFTCAVSAVFGA